MVTVEFVKGYMNRACQVDISAGEIVLTSKRGSILKEVAIVLRAELGVRCTVDQIKKQWRLRIRTLTGLETWRDKIGFIDFDRSKRLDRIIEERHARRPKGSDSQD